MSRGKLRQTSEVCADCGASDPKWASINRGVLICDECCSVHRSLGRHISQVKSLKKGVWSPTLLSTVHQLVSLGANNIWEHSLLDPSQNRTGRRKPNPRDPVHPTKADFIRAKYQFLAFSKKLTLNDDISTIEDLSRQLHSSVRTGNLETSLRILSLGANPNFVHPEKSNCAIHVAAQAGQTAQAELLVIFGADPGAMDGMGKTPVEYARAEGHSDLADRLVECQYELTDRLAYFLCGRKPDHRSGQHFIIPEMADSSLDLSELAKAAKRKLQALPNNLFEELAMDVYDEVDRRENDSFWLQSHSNLVSDRQTVPFLPVNPEFTSTRNQGRQKLARVNAREFATLVVDILSDAKRRQQGMSGQPAPHKDKSELSYIPRQMSYSQLSDDEPLYDIVASDEDYSSISDIQSTKGELNEEECSNHVMNKAPEKPHVNHDTSMQEEQNENPPVSLEGYLDVKKSLVASEARVQQLMQTNKDLKQHIVILQNRIDNMSQENSKLRSTPLLPMQPMQAGQSLQTIPMSQPPTDGIIRRQNSNSSNRPQSMFEQRDPDRPPWTQPMPAFREEMIGSMHSQEERLPDSAVEKVAKLPDQQSDTSDYDNNALQDVSESDRTTLTPDSQADVTEEGATAAVDLDGVEGLPSQEKVVKKTENITRKIQDLLQSARANKFDSYGPCSDKIHAAVTDMAALFPEKLPSRSVHEALDQLTSGAANLVSKCHSPLRDPADRRPRTQQVIQCAYDVAKAAKQLVTLFEIK